MSNSSFTSERIAKVTGSQIYGTDYRSRDMGWPKCQHAVIIRFQRPTQQFVGIDLNRVPDGCRPVKVVTATELAAAGVSNDAGWLGKPFFLPLNAVGNYVGQPLGIAYFTGWDSAAAFKTGLRQGAFDPVQYGPPTLGAPIEEQDVRSLLDPLLEPSPQSPGDKYESVNYVRLGTSPPGVDEFSFFNNGKHDPAVAGPAQEAVQKIERILAAEGARVVEGSFSTATNDTSFMEPECGIAWWDKDATCLRISLGTQSPEKDRSGINSILKGAVNGAALNVDLYARPPGGGFGGRDLSPFPLLLAVTAIMADTGCSVRLKYDRFEQFQNGIKRHAFACKSRLYYKMDGTLRGYFTRMVFNGGGTPNLTAPVVGLAALQAGGPYDIPMTVISGFGYHTHGATSGSMRGFGIPQAALAIESLVDEAARVTGLDAIKMRLSQLLGPKKRDVTGYTLQHPIGIRELCELALEEPLWKNRAADKLARDTPSSTYGVGFACCMESFGTSNDSALAAVEIGPEGPRVRSSVVDMGQGSTTSVSDAVAEALGRPAVEATMSEDAIFDALGLVVKSPPTAPNETPKRNSASSASMTAFFHLHAVRAAAQVVFNESIMVAAKNLWGALPNNVQWVNGVLYSENVRSLSWRELLKEIEAAQLPTGAMIHTYFRGRFATANFSVSGQAFEIPADALAVRGANGVYTPIARTSVDYPSGDELKSMRTLYAAAGHLVAVEVNRHTGRIQVVDCVCFLDPGVIHNKSILLGQVEGGFAMGLGMALTEVLPVPLSGVAPNWNFDKYQLPRAKHLPLKSLDQVRIVPVQTDGDYPPVSKGIAEATMSTVPVAISNAVAHAIGRRINRIPIQPSDVLASLEN